MKRAARLLASAAGRLRPATRPVRWGSRSATPRPRSRSAPGPASSTPTTPSGFWPTSTSPRPRPTATSRTSRWASYWRSCRGTSRSGKSSASRRRRSMAGNVGVLKHASNVTRCALDIEERLRRRRLPGRARSRRDRPGRRGQAPDRRRPDRRGHASPAASRPASRSRPRAASALKKHVLELGGSDAFIVLADADIAAAAKTAAKARFPERRPELHLRQALHRRGRGLRRASSPRSSKRRKPTPLGDPEDRATTMGPLARADLRDDLVEQIDGSVATGARVVLGGPHPGSPRRVLRADGAGRRRRRRCRYFARRRSARWPR